jgi:hypothetical protein
MSACVYLEVFMSTKNEEGVWIRSDGKPDPRKGALTGRQKTFARLIVEGLYSNAECARKAGYAVDTAAVYASKLLNGREYPHVLEYIDELREERERQYGVTTIGQLERLQQLSTGAEKAGQFSAAINAEKIRSALGGLVKVLSTGELCLFTADQGPKVASGGCSAVRGSRFESMGALVVGLGELVEAHYAGVLRPSAR